MVGPIVTQAPQQQAENGGQKPVLAKPFVEPESPCSTDDEITFVSELCQQRLQFSPLEPKVLQGLHVLYEAEHREPLDGSSEQIKQLFPHLTSRPLKLVHFRPAGPQDRSFPICPLKIGVVLAGGQAPGGHNVICGIFDYLQKWHPGSELIGFLNGPRGIYTNSSKVLTAEELEHYRNQGGFHLIASGRDKIEKPEQLAGAVSTCQLHDLDGLVVIGGDDSNTNAAVLAEHFLNLGLKTRVIGCPKTIDGDMKNDDVAISFGFDTCTKVYSELIGNIMIDALSARKYYHFIRLMGRVTSHVTLECALQTHPQMALISEEVHARRLGLADVVKQIADMVETRAERGANYGVLLVPEGLVEHMHDVSTLISEINEILAHNAVDTSPPYTAVVEKLTPESAAVFKSLPPGIHTQLLEERDPHGNVNVSHIETETLLMRLVEAELHMRKEAGSFKGKFAALPHFFGYEGRCALPSNFDSFYTYSLGQAAAALVAAGQTGMMATVKNLNKHTLDWELYGTPIVCMMHMERRAGKDKPVIKKAFVEMDGEPMKRFVRCRDRWAVHDCYRAPGPIQYYGRTWADVSNKILSMEINDGKPILLATGDPPSTGTGMRI